MMKKLPIIGLIAILLFLCVVPGMAEEVVEEVVTVTPRRTYTEIVVGTTTRPSGFFFTDMWGNNTSDIDVRALLHSYSPVYLSQQTTYEFNEQVVSDVSIADYPTGNRIYQITLHDDLKYSDGTPITAADYAFSLLLQANAAMEELGANSTGFNHIVGYEAYHANESALFSGVRLLGDLTFSIEIKGEYLPYFYELSMLDVNPYPIAAIAPGCEVVDTDRGVSIRNIDTTIEAPLFTSTLLRETILDPAQGYQTYPQVTSGPYTLTEYDAETGIARFARNPHFKATHDGAVPSIETLVLRPVSPSSMVELFAAEEVQVLNKVTNGQNITDVNAILGEVSGLPSNYPRMGFGFLSFACNQGPFESEAVRKAVAHAIDTEAFAADFSPYSVPVYGYMGIGQWMYQYVSQEEAPFFVTDEADTERWQALSLDVLDTYALDLTAAEQLLVDDGWTLNAQGGAYQKGTDAVRYKDVDGELTALSIRWGRTEGSQAAALIEAVLPDALAEIGIDLQIIPASFETVLEDYYAQEDRQFDMLCLATNFRNVFDPYYAFSVEDAYQGIYNSSGLRDAELEALALAMRETEPGDLLDYAERWLAFQVRWNDALPMLPLYSNIYFDFYVSELQNYNPDAEVGWSSAIVYAYTTEEKPEWLQAREAELEALQNENENDVVGFE